MVAVSKTWDKWISKKSLQEQLSQITKRLDTGEQTFHRMNACFATVMVVMLEICENAGVDCKKIKEKIAEAGINL